MYCFQAPIVENKNEQQWCDDDNNDEGSHFGDRWPWLVGMAIKELVEAEANADEEWIFVSSKDADLADAASTQGAVRSAPADARDSPGGDGGRTVSQFEVQRRVLPRQHANQRQRARVRQGARRAQVRLVSLHVHLPDKTTRIRSTSR
jgi:hypothetical protein